MKYSQITQTPCPKCNGPLLEIAYFCCSDVAHIACKKCGLQDKIPVEDARKREYETLTASGGIFGAGSLVRGKARLRKHHAPSDEDLAEYERLLKEYEPLANSPDENVRLDAYCKYSWKLFDLKAGPTEYGITSGPEYDTFFDLIEEYGYARISGPQIGFVGDKQAFEQPWELP